MLSCQENRAVGRERLFESAYGTGAADFERNFGKRKDNDIPNGDHRVSCNVCRTTIRVFFHTSINSFAVTETCKEGRAPLYAARPPLLLSSIVEHFSRVRY